MKKSKNWRNFYKGWDIAMSENVKLPDGWQKVKLSEIIEEVKERNITNNKEYPILTSSRKGIYIQEEYFNRVVASENLSNYKIIRKNEFTYRSMSDDQTFVFNRLELLEVGLVSPAYYVFKAKNSLSTFIKYFLNNSQEIKSQISKVIEGTTRTALRFNQVLKFVAMVPPLPEQRKIAEILETIDNAIEKTDAIIEKYKRIKQGLMQDLLTKGIDENWQIRNEKTHKFKDSLLGRIPEEWKVVKLKDVADIRLSNVDKKTDLKGKIIQLCNYLEVYQNDYIIKGMNFMHASATNNEIKKFKISKGDVIITKDSEEYNDIAKPAYVRDEIENLICGYHLALIKPLNNINGLFLSKVLSFRNVNIYFQQRANGITRFGLTKETITGAIIPLPLIPEQERIATILSQIDEVIEKEQAYKEKLERIKKGLMEDLLTGKVRVNHLIEEEEK